MELRSDRHSLDLSLLAAGDTACEHDRECAKGCCTGNICAGVSMCVGSCDLNRKCESGCCSQGSCVHESNCKGFKTVGDSCESDQECYSGVCLFEIGVGKCEEQRSGPDTSSILILTVFAVSIAISVFCIKQLCKNKKRVGKKPRRFAYDNKFGDLHEPLMDEATRLCRQGTSRALLFSGERDRPSSVAVIDD